MRGTLRLLVLDDDFRRHDWFDANIPGHDSVWSAMEARRALQENPRYDLVFLDHDLAEDYSVVPAVWGEDGRTVARFIAAMPADKRPAMAYIHSTNWGGASEMEAILTAAGVKVARAEFPTGCKEAISVILAEPGRTAGDHGQMGGDRAGDLLQGLERAWARSDALFRILTPDALAAQPIALRQPFIFYLGHLPAFAWNQVCRGVLGQPSFEPGFDDLFARGIDPMEADGFRPAPPDTWPALERVLEYRDRIRGALRAARPELGARAESDDDVLLRQSRIYAVALEHELMHHETFLYMVQQLPAAQKVRPAGLPAFERSGGAAPRTLAIPGGRVRIGADFDEVPFGWDNEFGRLEVDVDPFSMDATPVRNREFLEFVAAGGYARREHWTEADWAWREQHAIAHPALWRRAGTGWAYQTAFDEVPLDEAGDWPVYASWAEARAFSRWRGARLPTEAEWHWAAYGTPEGRLRSHPWGDEPPAVGHGNFGFRHWSPTPVGRFAEGASAWGVLDLVGNGWEWTATTFGPLPGFEPYIRTYPGYSTDFFDGRHYVLRGASWATDDALVRRSFRNWFQPHYPYVYAKFRCISD